MRQIKKETIGTKMFSDYCPDFMPYFSRVMHVSSSQSAKVWVAEWILYACYVSQSKTIKENLERMITESEEAIEMFENTLKKTRLPESELDKLISLKLLLPELKYALKNSAGLISNIAPLTKNVDMSEFLKEQTKKFKAEAKEKFDELKKRFDKENNMGDAEDE